MKYLTNRLCLLILCLMSVSCGNGKSDKLTDHSNLQAMLQAYEREIQARMMDLRNRGLLIPAEPDIQTAVWTYSNNSGTGFLQMNTDQGQSVYNLAKAIRFDGASIIPAEEDLVNLDKDQFRVLRINKNKRGEITGEIQIAPANVIAQIQDSILPKASEPMSLQTEAFFRISFSRGRYSYAFSDTLNIYKMLIDRVLQNREAYVTISSLYWDGKGQDGLTVNPSFTDSRMDPFLMAPQTGPSFLTPQTSLTGKVNMGISLHSLNGSLEPIHIYLEQSAINFLNPQALNDALVIVDLRLDEMNFNNSQFYNNDPYLMHSSPFDRGMYQGPAPYNRNSYTNRGSIPYNQIPPYMSDPNYAFGNDPASILNGSDGRLSSLNSLDLISSLKGKTLNPLHLTFEFSHSEDMSVRGTFQAFGLTSLEVSQTGGRPMISGINKNTLSHFVNGVVDGVEKGGNPLSYLIWPFLKLLGK